MFVRTNNDTRADDIGIFDPFSPPLSHRNLVGLLNRLVANLLLRSMLDWRVFHCDSRAIPSPFAVSLRHTDWLLKIGDFKISFRDLEPRDRDLVSVAASGAIGQKMKCAYLLPFPRSKQESERCDYFFPVFKIVAFRQRSGPFSPGCEKNGALP